MFEDQYVELLPARTTMKNWRGRKRCGCYNYYGGNNTSTSTGGAGGAGGDGGRGGDGGLNFGINVNPQVAVFGDNTSSFSQDASGGNGGAGGAGGAGGRAS